MQWVIGVVIGWIPSGQETKSLRRYRLYCMLYSTIGLLVCLPSLEAIVAMN